MSMFFILITLLRRYVITALLGHEYVFHSYYVIALLRRYLVMSMFFILITLLRYYGVTWS